MENLKKNLHFVVFGAGVLLGIIFLVAGIYIRGMTQDDLTAQQAKLSALKDVPTKGSLDQSDRRSKRFDTSLSAAEKVLKQDIGTRFTRDYRPFTDGRDFYTAEAAGKLSTLQTRFAAMEQPLQLPALLTGWKYSTTTSPSPLSQLALDMTNPSADKIRDMQMRLRVLEELATTMEKLLETGAGEGLGVKLKDVRFPSNFGPIGSSEMDSPWLALPFDIQIECSPGFALLLADELANPSQRTLAATTPTEAGKQSYTRIGFPVLVDMLQTVMTGRQHEMKLDIKNDDKPGVLAALNSMMGPGEEKLPVPQDPKALDPEKADGKRVVDEAIRAMNEKDRLVLPVQAGLKLKAVAFNKNWRAVKEDTPAE